MKKHIIISWVLSLVMALTIFSIPTSGFADSTEAGYCLGWECYDESAGDWTITPITGNAINFSDIAETGIAVYYGSNGVWENCWPVKVVWHNYDSDVAIIGYEDESYKYQEFSERDLEGPVSIKLIPKNAGTVDLSVDIYEDNDEETVPITIDLTVTVSAEDLPTDSIQYCMGWEDDGGKFQAVNNGDELSLSNIGFGRFMVYRINNGSWEYFSAERIVWHNSNPEVASMGTSEGECTEQNLEQVGEISLIPKQAGTTTLSVDVYETAESTVPLATISAQIAITQEYLDNIKYESYLYYYSSIAGYANYSSRTLTGTFPGVDAYNEDRGDYPAITADEISNIAIQVKVGDKDYSAAPVSKDGEYVYSVGFSQAALGTPVVITYTMGDVTRTEKRVVAKKVTPKVTAKNYTYNGKSRSASVTVKVGGTTLKKGRDYSIDSESIKNVGTGYYWIWTDIEKSKYIFEKNGSFKVNPKGATLSKLVKGKKKITVKWKKQAAKMSTSRITGYQIQLATNKKFTKNKKLVTVKGYKSASKTIKKLKKKKTYYVRIRTYKTVSGKKYYSAWSKIKSVKTK